MGGTTTEPRVGCPDCRQSVHQTELRRHLQSHLRYTPFECALCRTLFYTRLDAKIHFQASDGPHPGQELKIIESRNSRLESHLQTQLSRLIPRPPQMTALARQPAPMATPPQRLYRPPPAQRTPQLHSANHPSTGPRTQQRRPQIPITNWTQPGSRQAPQMSRSRSVQPPPRPAPVRPNQRQVNTQQPGRPLNNRQPMGRQMQAPPPKTPGSVNRNQKGQVNARAQSVPPKRPTNAQLIANQQAQAQMTAKQQTQTPKPVKVKPTPRKRNPPTTVKKTPPASTTDELAQALLSSSRAPLGQKTPKPKAAKKRPPQTPADVPVPRPPSQASAYSPSPPSKRRRDSLPAIEVEEREEDMKPDVELMDVMMDRADRALERLQASPKPITPPPKEPEKDTKGKQPCSLCSGSRLMARTEWKDHASRMHLKKPMRKCTICGFSNSEYRSSSIRSHVRFRHEKEASELNDFLEDLREPLEAELEAVVVECFGESADAPLPRVELPKAKKLKMEPKATPAKPRGKADDAPLPRVELPRAKKPKAEPKTATKAERSSNRISRKKTAEPPPSPAQAAPEPPPSPVPDTLTDTAFEAPVSS